MIYIIVQDFLSWEPQEIVKNDFGYFLKIKRHTRADAFYQQESVCLLRIEQKCYIYH